MGMSASQARLLSITARLTNNEFRAQTATNAKLRLADDTRAASAEYTEALDSKKLVFMNYNENCEASTVDVTPNLIYAFEPLKNQYAMIDNSGRMLVNAFDAKNYETTNKLSEFLDKYNLIDRIPVTRDVEVKNPEWDSYMDALDDWRSREPNRLDPQYWSTVPVYRPTSELYDSFLWATACCYGDAMTALAYFLGEPGETLFDSEGYTVLSYDPNAKTNTLYCDDHSGNILLEENIGISPALFVSCYCHVLSHLLPIGSYTTSTGGNVSIYDSSSSDNYSHWWKYYSGPANNRATRAEQLANIIADTTNVTYCCAKTKPDQPCDITSSSSEVEKLMSDYLVDGSVKTLQQKIVDLDYAMANGIMSYRQAYDAIKHFVNEDLTMINPPVYEDVFDEAAFNNDYNDWLADKPAAVPETVVEAQTTNYMSVRDKEKAQWYTNLWFKMNGSESANIIKEMYYNVEDFPEFAEKKIISLGDVDKTQKVPVYKIMDENLATSSEWLQFALEQGIITLSQAIFNAPAQDGKRVLDIKSEGIEWTPIVLGTSAKDLVYVDDEAAISQAEVKYKNTMRKIQNKDKKYDQDLKKLDTEHNALQSELDSIKTVIDKNTDRSFKLFS